MRTPRPTLYEQTDTPGGSIYWEPHVDGIPIPVEGNSYGSIDEAFHMYVKYAEMAGFEVKKGGQKKTKSGAVLNKYIYCNKEGVPKPININTLDPQYQKQKRNTTTHATVKAAANKIGATKAHHLYCNIKGGYEYVHGTTDDFKNHQRDVNHFIVAKCNYKEFGDIVSFDATFNSNKSESENSFFKSFTSPGATLVSFMMSYESAMERQRYRQEKLDFNTIDAAPKFITQLDIESHASKVYTRTMFLIVQTEINEGCWNCTVQGLNRDEVKQTNDVQVKNPTKAVNKGEHLKKGERLKSEREKAIKVAKKKARPCGFCKEVTNEHTKLTCPLNPNARKKRKATPGYDV
ncbi:FAR1-related sequence 5-like protein [Tanacetum coccineum]